MIYFARYTSVDEQSFTCDCSIISHYISLSEILGQATYRTWWKHIDPFCPTFSCFLYSSLFPFQWPSSTPLQPVSLMFVLAESIQECLMRYLHPGALGLPELQCHYQVQCRICCLPPSRHPSHCDYPSGHCSQANFRCQKCIQELYPYHFQLDDGQFIWLDGHLILEFLLQGGPLQRKQVAMVIFLKISMQLHHHVESLTRMLSWSLEYL